MTILHHLTEWSNLLIFLNFLQMTLYDTAHLTVGSINIPVLWLFVNCVIEYATRRPFGKQQTVESDCSVVALSLSEQMKTSSSVI